MSKRQMASVDLPPGFTDNMTAKLVDSVRQQHGADFDLESLDLEAGKAVFVRHVAVAQVRRDTIELPKHLSTTTSGERVQSMIEERKPGYTMIEFHPHKCMARMGKMSDDEKVARAAVAEAIGVKPWEVGLVARPGGGYMLTRLPGRYTPSRHNAKLTEVAEAKVPGGKPGWFVTIDGATLTGEIVPAELPTFDAVYRYDLSRLANAKRDVIPIGRDLPAPGQRTGAEFTIDFTDSANALVSGTAGGGKTVGLNAIIAGSLAGGCELVIVDTPDKSIDFVWCKEMVRPGGWGCESLEHAATALTLMYREGQRRAKWMKEHHPGAQKWLDLPAKDQFKPILAVIDEFPAVTDVERIPSGLPKDSAIRFEIERENYLRSLVKRMAQKIMREMRFVGLRVIVSSQVANNQTGLGPSDKAQMGHRILMGHNPSKGARSQAFNDDQAVPEVPGNVQADAEASRGSGAYESMGRSPSVFKSYFASPADYARALRALGVPTTSRPAPTMSEVAECLPDDSDFDDDEPVPSRLATEGGWGERDGRDAPPPAGLRGAAKASHELKQILDGHAGT